MMRIDVITLFPDIFSVVRDAGVTGRAHAQGLWNLHAWNPREFTHDVHRTVDDRPYGGGPGMVMMAEPLRQAVHTIQAARAQKESTPHAVNSHTLIPHALTPNALTPHALNHKTLTQDVPRAEIRADTDPDKDPDTDPDAQADSTANIKPKSKPPVILLSPAGKRFSQSQAATLAASEGAIFVCGRYEGIDQRFIDECVDEQWSLGDFVLSGGEIAALAMIDSAVRLIPGALNHGDSCLQDSFQDSISGLLDSPHYTRPESLDGQVVPPVLLSGNHAHIARWRREQSLVLTAKQRPDLLQQAREKGLLSKADEKFLASLAQ